LQNHRINNRFPKICRTGIDLFAAIQLNIHNMSPRLT
jgi:hypothetical protein